MNKVRVRDCLLGLTLTAASAFSACGGESAPDGRQVPGSMAASGAGRGGFPPNPTGVAGASGPIGGPSGNPSGLAGSGPAQPSGPMSNPNPDSVCEVVHLTADPQTPDMMIVLDRSGSMSEGGRWQPSVSAVRRVATELESKIRFGLAMFPDPKVNPMTAVTNTLDCVFQPDPQSCIDMITAAAGDSCAPGNVVVPVGEMKAMAIGTALSQTQPFGGTPTSGTLESLVESFANQPAGPDAMGVHAKYVLLVTDGQPTCPAGEGQETTPADIDASNKAIEALLAKEVRTYVIGYDTSGAENMALATVLDGFATRGGTGDMKHRPVEDEASLVMELERITGAIVGCSFTLDKPPTRADFVLVRLDGKQLNLDAPDGWKLVGDRTVELSGQACEAFRSAGSHILDAEVQCSVVGPA